jgi:hypothetical protein
MQGVKLPDRERAAALAQAEAAQPLPTRAELEGGEFRHLMQHGGGGGGGGGGGAKYGSVGGAANPGQQHGQRPGGLSSHIQGHPGHQKPSQGGLGSTGGASQGSAGGAALPGGMARYARPMMR